MANHKIYRASTTAPVNMAVIKYWGKRDANLNLPTNSSLSVTLAQSDLMSYTTASCSEVYHGLDDGRDTLALNGEPQDITKPRTQACLRSLRMLRASLESANPALPALSTMPLRIVSTNNFPTAAGLASSAAGFAALVRAVADLYELPQSPRELSLIARQGSGSACRSLMGGYVAWRAGTEADGSDSMAEQVQPASHWPDLRALILVISAAKKDVGSTIGMQTTANTSALFQTRAQDVVPQRMKQMEASVAQKDFSAFAMLTMRDSNTLHACCADAYPPVYYMTDASRAAVRFVERINEIKGEVICAYTFDAGPNCVVFYERKHSELVEGAFRSVIGGVVGWNEAPSAQSFNGHSGFSVDEKIASVLAGGVSRVICTGVGEGPISVKDHLIDENGAPVVL